MTLKIPRAKTLPPAANSGQRDMALLVYAAELSKQNPPYRAFINRFVSDYMASRRSRK